MKTRWDSHLVHWLGEDRPMLVHVQHSDVGLREKERDRGREMRVSGKKRKINKIIKTDIYILKRLSDILPEPVNLSSKDLLKYFPDLRMLLPPTSRSLVCVLSVNKSLQLHRGKKNSIFPSDSLLPSKLNLHFADRAGKSR